MSQSDFVTVRSIFNAVARDYDEQRRRLIPCFDGFYGALAMAVDAFAPEMPTVLDLGAGTGLAAAFVGEVRPHARLVLLDGADSMLEAARRRFAGRREVEYRVGDYRATLGDERCDVIVSALSIHHLTHEEKAGLYRRVFAQLKPGGLFVNADQVLGENAALEARQDAAWKAAIAASGLPPAAIAAALERVKQDRNAPLPDNLRWLADAGFAEPTCFFRDQRFAVFGAVKRKE